MFDHPYILLIVIAASLLRWFWQKSQVEKQDPERPSVPDQPIPRGGEAQTEEERVRRFLEALGQPPGSAPPKVAPKRQIRPRVFPTLPPLTTAPPPLPPPLPTTTTRAAPARPIPARIFKPAIVQETGFEVHDLAMQTPREPPTAGRQIDSEQSTLGLKLATTEGLRSAIILREIFGPPRSLQPFDPVGSF